MTSGLERIVKHAKGERVDELKEQPKVIKPESGSLHSGESLQKAVDNFLVQQNKQRKTIRKTASFGPSHTQMCSRWWFLSFEGAPIEPKFDARTLRIFDTGHSVHSRWYQYFRQMKILVDEEVPIVIKDPVPIQGSADAIIDWGGHKLVEMKSIGMEGFQFRKYYNKPKDEHYAQAQLYMYALKLEEGFVIYEDKSSQNVLIFELKRDDEIIAKLFKRYSKWYKIIQEGVIPPRPYKRDSKACQSCEFLNHCWDTLKD